MTPTGSLSRAATGIAVYSVWLGFAGRGFSTQTFHRQINRLRPCNRWSPESWQNCESAVPPPIRRHYHGGARIICRFAQVRTHQSTYTSGNDVSTYETNNVVKVRGCEEKRGARQRRG